MQNLLGKELIRNLHLEVRLERFMIDSVLDIALGRLEASAHSGGLLVGGARCKLGRELGLEGPLGFDDEVGTGRAPAGLVGRGDGHLRLGKVTHLDLGAHLRLDDCRKEASGRGERQKGR